MLISVVEVFARPVRSLIGCESLVCCSLRHPFLMGVSSWHCCYIAIPCRFFLCVLCGRSRSDVDRDALYRVDMCDALDGWKSWEWQPAGSGSQLVVFVAFSASGNFGGEPDIFVYTRLGLQCVLILPSSTALCYSGFVYWCLSVSCHWVDWRKLAGIVGVILSKTAVFAGSIPRLPNAGAFGAFLRRA